MKHLSSKIPIVFVYLITILFSQSCKKDEDLFPRIDWVPESCSLTGNASLLNQNAKWTGARASFSGSSKVFIIQLMTAGVSGSYISPGKGWLSISLHLDTEENIIIPVTNYKRSPSPSEVPLNEATIVYTNPISGQNFYLTGKIKLGRYRLIRKQGRFEIDINLDLLQLPNGGGSFSGDLAIVGQT